ncbi:superoxide dismutase [Dyadobacter pollutisoli]|jgi:Fe-Mn family superoxide dismutase|uniref:Superoxide dismutase n=1 Tax=Dyadobacter pollutisoli TaxID=2910158 RepID=A0A9E8NBT9_9BACT|nr:superoxide dismutase [Dyadobacter pollutisoli]WAC12126.1 superoxide dismutase [Dyadobacter pollutisoli]
MNRTDFLRTLAGSTLAVGALAEQSFAGSSTPLLVETAPFKQAPLPYDFGALEPSIDKMTMEIHYGKHHAAYVKNLNDAVKGTAFESQSLDEIIKSISKAPMAIRNNGGGHWNHTFFWEVMGPKKSAAPSGAVADAINGQFGSFDKFKEEFAKAAATRFGSGWAWLVAKGGKLEVGSTPNQDNPLMDISDIKGTPILALDVWEHAYYLHYQNKRPDYIKAFWNVVNWDKVAENLKKA